MTKDPLYERWQQLIWRRKLTAIEEAELQAWLAVHPEVQAEWEADARLSEALARLASPPVASNFTARVLQMVEKGDGELSARQAPRVAWWRRFYWAPGGASAALVLGAGLLFLHHSHEQNRIELAKSVAVISTFAALPGPEALEDFDAIRRLSQSPQPDDELVALLQ